MSEVPPGGDCSLGTESPCERGSNCEGDQCVPLVSLLTQSLGEECFLGPEFALCGGESVCSVVEVGDGGVTTRAECVPLSTSGGVCYLGSFDTCPSGEYCDANPGAGRVEGVCRPRPGPGSPCAYYDHPDYAAFPLCASGAYCAGATCIERKANGEACTVAWECHSLKCNSELGCTSTFEIPAF